MELWYNYAYIQMGFIKNSIGCAGNLTVTMYTFHIILSLNCIGYYFGLFVALQDYGDSIDLDGFDIDYGVRIILVEYVIKDWQQQLFVKKCPKIYVF